MSSPAKLGPDSCIIIKKMDRAEIGGIATSRALHGARNRSPISVRHIKTSKIIQIHAVVDENGHICLHACYLYRPLWYTATAIVRTVVTAGVRMDQY